MTTPNTEIITLSTGDIKVGGGVINGVSVTIDPEVARVSVNHFFDLCLTFWIGVS